MIVKRISKRLVGHVSDIVEKDLPQEKVKEVMDAIKKPAYDPAISREKGVYASILSGVTIIVYSIVRFGYTKAFGTPDDSTEAMLLHIVSGACGASLAFLMAWFNNRIKNLT